MAGAEKKEAMRAAVLVGAKGERGAIGFSPLLGRVFIKTEFSGEGG
jgi:hypothetical protein